jgi:hypothetical protein
VQAFGIVSSALSAAAEGLSVAVLKKDIQNQSSRKIGNE